MKIGKNYSVLRFLMVYGILMGLFIFLIGYQPVKDVLDINGYFTAFLIKMTVIFLKLFGLNPVVEGSIITINDFSMNVLFCCNGLKAFLIYTVGIISFPAKISHKIWGIMGMGLGIYRQPFYKVWTFFGTCLSISDWNKKGELRPPSL